MKTKTKKTKRITKCSQLRVRTGLKSGGNSSFKASDEWHDCYAKLDPLCQAQCKKDNLPYENLEIDCECSLYPP